VRHDPPPLLLSPPAPPQPQPARMHPAVADAVQAVVALLLA
jgi:hypothetical protein